ncbi:MAG: ABC transporter permease [Vicinamibacterales bacterium]
MHPGLAAAVAQLRMTRRNIEDLFPILTIPLSSAVALAILQHSGRSDLAGYALVAAVLMSVGQMALFIGSEILANERQGQTLELVVASPTSYYLPLLARIWILTVIGMAGFVEAWAIARWVFGIEVHLHHPWVGLATLLVTSGAAAVTALIASVVFCFGKTTRTYQNALAGPLYLLSGVLVPITFLPEAVQPISRAIFFSWSAGLLRDALQPAPPENVGLRLGAVVALGFAGGAIGAVLFGRLLGHLRREGTLGL